jgi:2-polyprenyl-3-methyl-5-hydroxy-6-metoxy-1,4-benzoquinol methylase
MVAQKVKRAVLTRMAASGYGVIRTEPRRRPRLTHFDPALLGRVSDEVGGLGLNPREWEVWSSPKAVLDYLEPPRVNSYHQVVQLCADHGVDLAGRSVLDVGTCSGYLLRIVAEKFPDARLAGTDYYEECVRLSRALVPQATVTQASIDDLKAGQDSYDVIFCTEVLEHIVDTETQIPGLLARITPGGALVVTVPNGQYDATPAFTSGDGVSYVGHVNYWTPQSWRFYIDRIVATLPDEVEVHLGELGNLFDGDVLYALIRKV